MRLSYANVMATAAMFVALGGTSYAVTKLPKNSVGSREVKDRSLQATDLAPGVITAGATGARGPRGAEGPQGPIGPSDVIFRKRDGDVVVGFAAHSTVNLVTSTLPAGLWLVQADTNPVYFPNTSPSQDFFRAGLFVDGQSGDDAEMFGGNGTGATHAGHLGMSQIVNVQSSATVILRGSHDNDLPGGSSQPIFVRSKLIATRIGSAIYENVPG